MININSTYSLRNSYTIPCIGFGTFEVNDGDETINSVLEALKQGYRHIDTATRYNNEESVGLAIKQSGINRDEIFVTSKLWNSDQGYETTLKAFDTTLTKLDMEYLDLYLIHWPIPVNHKEDWEQSTYDTWRAMEKLYKDGKIKAIGVSNFKPHHLKALIEKAEIMPMINQIELHPSHLQEETVTFCIKNNILIEAWGPLSRGKIFTVKEIQEIANKYNKTIAQVTLRWHIQNGIIPLPKSVTPSRIKENLDIFDFELSLEDMIKINEITNCSGTGIDPDNISF